MSSFQEEQIETEVKFLVHQFVFDRPMFLQEITGAAEQISNEPSRRPANAPRAKRSLQLQPTDVPQVVTPPASLTRLQFCRWHQLQLDF